MIMHFFEPRWWGPRWYRERDLNRLDLRDPYTALLKAAATPSLGERSSKAVEARLETGPRLARWRVAWVPERRKGRRSPNPQPFPVEGVMSLYEGTLTFRATGYQDRLWGRSTVFAIDAQEVRGARVVGVGRWVRGSKRSYSRGLRSMFRRLVLETDDGPLVFEVMSAKRKAARISRGFGFETVDAEARSAPSRTA